MSKTSSLDCLDRLEAVRQFVDRVESRAEAKMLQTGKLEGAHYAAMTQILAEMEREAALESGTFIERHSDKRTQA